MRDISSSELRSNMKKHLDMARTEQIVIQRGKKRNIYFNQTRTNLSRQ